MQYFVRQMIFFFFLLFLHAEPWILNKIHKSLSLIGSELPATPHPPHADVYDSLPVRCWAGHINQHIAFYCSFTMLTAQRSGKPTERGLGPSQRWAMDSIHSCLLVLWFIWTWVNIGLDNGLMPYGTKPLSQPMLINRQLKFVMSCYEH